ncbi:hypothetical protein RI367_000239 [Sorochytrium milnesiophthora]
MVSAAAAGIAAALASALFVFAVMGVGWYIVWRLYLSQWNLVREILGLAPIPKATPSPRADVGDQDGIKHTHHHSTDPKRRKQSSKSPRKASATPAATSIKTSPREESDSLLDTLDQDYFGRSPSSSTAAPTPDQQQQQSKVKNVRFARHK